LRKKFPHFTGMGKLLHPNNTNKPVFTSIINLHAICIKSLMNYLKEDTQTICVIDDDKIQHFTIEKSIQLQGISKTLLSFLNGEEAIIFLNKNLENLSMLPDIIFLDINMPVINGWQFLQQYASIKEEIKKNIKIYVVSSSINENEINMAKANINVSGFLSKPLKPEELRNIIAS